MEPIRLRRENLVDFPFCINFELTSRCNLRCTYCPRDNMVKMKVLKIGDMDPRLFEEVVDQGTRFADRTKVGFWPEGLGDPLMYSGLADAIKLIKKKSPDAPVGIDTNGTLLTAEQSRILCEGLAISDVLKVSLNAGSPETYARLNRVDNFDLVVQNTIEFLRIRRELRKGPRLIIQILESAITAKEIQGFKEFWAPLIDEGDTIKVKPLQRWAGRADEDLVSVEGNSERYPCLSLWISTAIDVDGNVYPCCQGYAARDPKEGLLLGNLREKSLKTIYSGDKIKDMRGKHLNGKWDEIPECSRCDLWYSYPNVWFKVGKRWV